MLMDCTDVLWWWCTMTNQWLWLINLMIMDCGGQTAGFTLSGQGGHAALVSWSPWSLTSCTTRSRRQLPQGQQECRTRLQWHLPPPCGIPGPGPSSAPPSLQSHTHTQGATGYRLQQHIHTVTELQFSTKFPDVPNVKKNAIFDKKRAKLQN